MAAPATSTQTTKKPEPISPFGMLHKYRLPIFYVCIFSLFGFGVWGVIADSLNLSGSYDPDELIATWEWNGESHDVTRGEFDTILYQNRSQYDAEEDRAAAVLATLIRAHMIKLSGVHVSDDEMKKVIDTDVKDNVRRAMGLGETDAVDKIAYRKYTGNIYRQTPDVYETLLRDGLTAHKFMRDIDRASDDTTTAEIFEYFKKSNAKIKLKGVFFSTDTYKDAAKLATEKVGDVDELTAESRTKLETWWKALSEMERKAYHKGGAVLDVEGIGFRFMGKTDAELDAEFKKEDAVTKTSLERLTAEFAPTAADLDRMKTRLGMSREAYGMAADADIEAVFVEKQPRLITEWKIWTLVKKVHSRILADIEEKKTVIFADVAQANGLQSFRLSRIKLEAMLKHEEYPGFYVGQLAGVEPGRVLNFSMATGPGTTGFENGPVDEIGKHVSIFRMIEKELNPEPVLLDVQTEALAGFERTELVRLRDQAVDAFKGTMDEHMSLKAKEFIDRVNAETAEAITKDTTGLDPETDKAKIEEITKAKNAEAETRIKEEKNKYKSEAFDVALGNVPAGAVVVEEGFFVPNSAATETPADREKAELTAKARSSLRREFRTLQDVPASDTYQTVGTVSDPVDSPYYPGLRGIGKLVEKKEPTAQDMFYNPQQMQMAEGQIRQKKNPRNTTEQDTMWSWSSLVRVFNVKSSEIDKRIASEQQRTREAEAKAAQFQAEQAAKEAAMRAQNPLGQGDQVPFAPPGR